MHRISLIVSLAVISTLTADLAVAQTQVGYRGRLEDAATGPLTGDYDIRFELWTSATSTDFGADGVWWEEQVLVPVMDGSFAVRLGSSTPINDDLWLAYPTLYLAVAVRPSGSGTWTPMQNRQEMMHAPLALRGRNLQVCVRRTASANPNNGATFSLSALCASGEVAVAGGWSTTASHPNGMFATSYPASDLLSWEIRGYNGSGASRSVTGYAVCCP